MNRRSAKAGAAGEGFGPPPTWNEHLEGSAVEWTDEHGYGHAIAAARAFGLSRWASGRGLARGGESPHCLNAAEPGGSSRASASPPAPFAAPAEALASVPFRDPDLPVEERIEGLKGRSASALGE